MIRYCHIPVTVTVRNTTKETMITAAYTRDPMSLNIGLSICSPRDQFCKRTGRNQAELRLTTEPIQLPCSEALGPREIKDAIKTLVRLQVQLGNAAHIPESWTAVE